jgi:acyl phosphate:glycerol-3-phosphate acyltransferase
MPFFTAFLVLLIGYLIGSIPVGLIIVKIANGKDVRQIGSGRTGGTNVGRAAGWFAGLLTGGLDLSKGLAAGLVADSLLPGSDWVKVFAMLLMILGSIHSVFLIERDPRGRLLFKGGAGGSTTLGGAIALWPMSAIYILPVAAIAYFIIGYASITTFSIALSAFSLFAWRAFDGLSPKSYVVYGALAIVTVIYTLRPNFRRLQNGTERTVGLRAYLQKNRRRNPSPLRGLK